jgi:hypothetical protein
LYFPSQNKFSFLDQPTESDATIAESACEPVASPIPEPSENFNEDIRIQIALFETVIESLRYQIERLSEQGDEREHNKITSHLAREKLLSPDKCANDSVLFKLHETAKASEEQTAELLRLVRLLEEAGACERAAREEAERNLALALGENEALLEQAVAVTMEKEQLMRSGEERPDQVTCVIEAMMEEEKMQAQQRFDALALDWQQKLNEATSRFEHEQSIRMKEFALQAEEAKHEHARVEIAKAFVCFEGKQQQFNCKVSELEKEIEVRKVINLSLQQEMEELKVLNVHLEMEQEKWEELKTELAQRELLVTEMKERLETEQAEAALLASVRHGMEQREQKRADELKSEMEKLQAMRGEMERRQQQTEELKAQLEAMKNEMERRQGQLAELKAQMEAKHAKAEEVRCDWEAKQAAQVKWSEDLEERKQVIEAQAVVVGRIEKEKQNQIDELKATLERMKQEYAQLETENESLQLALVEQQSRGSEEQSNQEATMQQAASLVEALKLVQKDLEYALEKKTSECAQLEEELAKSNRNVNIGKSPFPVVTLFSFRVVVIVVFSFRKSTHFQTRSCGR